MEVILFLVMIFVLIWILIMLFMLKYLFFCLSGEKDVMKSEFFFLK